MGACVRGTAFVRDNGSGRNLVIPRGFQRESEFLTQGFSLQKSVKIYSIKEIPWNGEAAIVCFKFRDVMYHVVGAKGK